VLDVRKCHRQFLHTIKGGCGWNALQQYIPFASNVSKAFEKHTKRDFGFQAREWRTDAEMNTVPEGDMTVRRAVNIEGLWIGKLFWIAIR